MSRIERKQRAPDLKALGLALAVGALIARAVTAQSHLAGVAALAAVGAGCYYVGMQWE